MITVPASDIAAVYRQYRSEFEAAMQTVLESGQFIGGNTVSNLESQLSEYLDIRHVIGCGNGTDALQLALMALDLPKGSKVIVPAFTYIAPVEVIRFLGYEPVYCDVDPHTFNCTAETIANAWSPGVKAVMPVHLFGQCCDMKAIHTWAEQHDGFIIEDNAQSLAANRDLSGSSSLITTSFFPTKNLGAFGDGGAVLCNDDTLARKIRQLANHGQAGKKYIHESIGINSRLDGLQAAVLQVKLKHLDALIGKRKDIAASYDAHLSDLDAISIPKRSGEHTFHQYTLRVDEQHRDALAAHLQSNGIPVNIYYPLPAYRQQAFEDKRISLPNTEALCRSVLSLPMHTNLDEPVLSYICEQVHRYFKP